MAQSNRSSKSSASRSKRSASASKPSASRKRSTSRTSASQRSTTNQSANGTGALDKITGAVTTGARKARLPAIAGGAAAAAAAVAGGKLLKRQLAPKRRKVLGVPVPRPNVDGLFSGGLDLKPVAKGIASAGKRAAKTSQQLRKLSDDVEQVGKTAQKVGDSLS